mgnify:CR=1 FL=1
MQALCWAEEFLLSEKAAGKAPCTLRNRRAALEKLERWLAEQSKAEADLTPADLREFVNGLRLRLSADHVNGVVAALRTYFPWCAEEGLREANPALRLKFLRPAPRPVEALTEQEVSRLVKTATRLRPRERFATHRNAALALLLLDTGLRVGEAVRLRLCDVRLGENGEGQLMATATKTKSVRVVGITPALRVHLTRYLRRRAVRVALLGADTDLLFFSEQGGPLTVDRAEEGIRRLGERANLGRRLYPHLLRHTWATLSLTNGAPLPAVMRLGGWRKLETVQRYTHFSDAAATAVHRATSPLSAGRR